MKLHGEISVTSYPHNLTVLEQFLRTFTLWRKSPLPDLSIFQAIFQANQFNLNNLKEYFKQTIALAILFSLALHAFVMFGIGFALPDPSKSKSILQPLEVVLVNSKSKSKPVKADALAQHNLDGGGNTTDNERAKSPLPSFGVGQQFTPEQSTQRLQRLEQQVKKLLTQAQSVHTVPQEHTEKQRKDGSNMTGQDLVQRALEIARLEAQINRDFNEYQKMPQRKFIGARTQEYRYAQYIEDWRIKVERIGNLNYPSQARQQKIFGKLQLTVSIRANGTLEGVEVTRSSGQRILDAAAVRIVKLAAPYAPFPEDIRKDTEILSIVRTWSFTANDQMETE